VNGDRTDANGIEYQKRDKKNELIDCDKAQINKHPRAEGEQHTVKNKQKEDLQIMRHKVRLLQISERELLYGSLFFQAPRRIVSLVVQLTGLLYLVLSVDLPPF